MVPFVPTVTSDNPAGSAASELQSIINTKQSEGWEFVSLSSLQTTVTPPKSGCFGPQGETKSVGIQLLIFKMASPPSF